MSDQIKRVDKYNVTVNGFRVRADEIMERVLRDMDSDALARFVHLMGAR